MGVCAVGESFLMRRGGEVLRDVVACSGGGGLASPLVLGGMGLGRLARGELGAEGGG